MFDVLPTFFTVKFVYCLKFFYCKSLSAVKLYIFEPLLPKIKVKVFEFLKIFCNISQQSSLSDFLGLLCHLFRIKKMFVLKNIEHKFFFLQELLMSEVR